MAIQDKPLADITEEDLRALITNGVAEQRTLDYKRDLPGNSDKENVELRKDVSSFANAAGGHLIFGMDAKNGIPVNLCGTETTDPDGDIRRMEGIIGAGIKPRIQGVEMRPLKLDSGRFVIIIRIPRSWVAPHMAMNTANWGLFFSRNSVGKYPLDIGEIRSAFIRSESVADRIRAFRADRLAKIVAGETPVQLPQGPKIVLHLVPFGAFDPGVSYPVTASEQRNNVFASLHPIGTMGKTSRLNFDGALTYGDPGYVQIFRNGCVEAVDTRLLKPHEGRRTIPSIAYEHDLIVAFRAYLAFLNQLGVEPPIAIMLSFLGVAGYTMAVSSERYFPLDEHPVDRNDLLVPEVVIDSYDHPAEEILKPCFDAIWNATGWERSMNYDAEGRWLSPYR